MESNSQIIFYCESKAKNPWVVTNRAGCKFPFINAVLGHLTAINKNAEIYPDLLESFNFDFDKKYYKLRLKENLIFHNGRKVTVNDLEFSLVRYFFAKKSNPGSMMLMNIKGSDKIHYGQPFQSGLVEGVKILAERTVIVTPSQPNPAFLYTLARFGSLVPIEELEDNLLTWKKWPIGAGPYKMINENSVNKTYLLQLVNDKKYPNAPKEILYEQSRYLEPDITLTDGIAANNNKFKQETLCVPLLKKIINFNYNSELGNNKDFRKAVSLAISRNEISNKTMVKTIPLFEMIPPRGIGRINMEEQQNTLEARKLFEKVLGKNNNFVFKIPHSEDKSFLGNNYHNVIQSQLAAAGLKVEFHETDNLWDPFSGKFKKSPFKLIGTGTDHFDPLLTFSLYRKDSPAIHFWPNDEMVDKLIENSKAAETRDKLNENLKKLSMYFFENKYTIPLFEIPTVAYYKAEKIKSLGSQFGGLVFYLPNIEINQITP
jgi:oligopeptide transport system substrate-binding protein